MINTTDYNDNLQIDDIIAVIGTVSATIAIILLSLILVRTFSSYCSDCS